MSMTLPKWFGRKSKKINNHKDNDMTKNQNQLKESIPNRTHDTDKFHTIRPSYEFSKKQPSLKPYSPDSNNDKNEIMKQYQRDKFTQEIQIHSNINQQHDETKIITLKHENNKYSIFNQENHEESSSIYGGR